MKEHRIEQGRITDGKHNLYQRPENKDRPDASHGGRNPRIGTVSRSAHSRSIKHPTGTNQRTRPSVVAQQGCRNRHILHEHTLTCQRIRRPCIGGHGVQERGALSRRQAGLDGSWASGREDGIVAVRPYPFNPQGLTQQFRIVPGTRPHTTQIAGQLRVLR